MMKGRPDICMHAGESAKKKKKNDRGCLPNWGFEAFKDLSICVT